MYVNKKQKPGGCICILKINSVRIDECNIMKKYIDEKWKVIVKNLTDGCVSI